MKRHIDTVLAGRVRFQRAGAIDVEWRDIYHSILTLTWSQFAAWILGLYLVVNLLFALLYFFTWPSISGMPRDSFSDAFFFSVETLATVGYGHMYPQTFLGHIVATAEIISGMFGMAVISGVIFVRFSRPSARLKYSDCLVISPVGDKSMLMFRIANLRRQAMVEAEFRLMVVRKEAFNRDIVHHFLSLHLEVDRVILFPAVLTLRHVIDDSSPLYGLTPKDFESCNVRFLVSVVCIDTVISATVQSYRGYDRKQILWDQQFVEITREVADDWLEVDYDRLSETEPAPTAE